MSPTPCGIAPPTLTFSHRSGVTPYTSSCELAGSCVFGKQSPGRLSLQPLNKEGQALSLTYGRFFAEFLKDESLVPLGLLALSTSVGLRYGGLTIALTSFSRKALHRCQPGKFLTFSRYMLELSTKNAKPIRHIYLSPLSFSYDRAVGLEY